MAYKDALYDGSDPAYAPGISWVRGRYAFWKAPKKYIDAGFEPRRIPLAEGAKDDEQQLERATLCRKYTREMLEWFQAEEQIESGTWAWLISKYRTDEYSAIHKVKANTREGYEWTLDRWVTAIGHIDLTEANYEFFVKIVTGMEKKGRSVAYIKRFFTMLRIVVNYGALIEDDEAKRIAGVLSRMRIKTPKARVSAPSRDQIEAIVAASDEDGNKAFSLGILIQWWFALRAVDVRGQWLPTDEPDGGLVRNGRRWQDGLTWNMISSDISTMRKSISKTGEALGEDLEFDLTYTPDLQDRLRAIPKEARTGPVIISNRSGLPYTRSGWTTAFRRYARAAGVPEGVWMMDVRSGAITEAEELGATLPQLRDQAAHTQSSTTNRYMRGRNKNISKVVKLRTKS